MTPGAWLSIDPGRGQRLMRFVLVVAWLAAAASSIDFLLSVAGKYQPPNPDADAMFQDRRGWLFAHLAARAVQPKWTLFTEAGDCEEAPCRLIVVLSEKPLELLSDDALWTRRQPVQRTKG